MAHEFVIATGEEQSHYVFHEQGVTLSSPRRRHVRWEAFRTLWLLPNSLLLFYSDTGYFIFPKPELPEDASEFLMEKLQALGVRFKTLAR